MRPQQVTLLRVSLALNASLLFSYSLWYLREEPSAAAPQPRWPQPPPTGPLTAALSDLDMLRAPLGGSGTGLGDLSDVLDSGASGGVGGDDGAAVYRTGGGGVATGGGVVTGGSVETGVDSAEAATTAGQPPELTDTTINGTTSEVSSDCALHALQHCQTPPTRTHTAMRGTRYWVMYNFAVASRRFHCAESVTYTTHGDFTFLDNLVPLLKRWRGPVSFGLYAPGDDFLPSVATIAYLRQCEPLVAELTTFHIIYDVDKVPLNVSRAAALLAAPRDCATRLPPAGAVSFRKAKRLTYPVNVARNVARETVMTHYVLPSDVELYPSAGLVEQFLAMLRSNAPVLCSPRPRVFVLSIFEVAKDMTPPEHKNQLTTMLKNGTAIPFHKSMCARCHTVPKAKEWTFSLQTDTLEVFHVGKRYAPFEKWEPIYISTNQDPGYDERLTWEGKMDNTPTALNRQHGCSN